jgi:hypothetical protein
MKYEHHLSQATIRPTSASWTTPSNNSCSFSWMDDSSWISLGAVPVASRPVKNLNLQLQNNIIDCVGSRYNHNTLKQKVTLVDQQLKYFRHCHRFLPQATSNWPADGSHTSAIIKCSYHRWPGLDAIRRCDLLVFVRQTMARWIHHRYCHWDVTAVPWVVLLLWNLRTYS